MKYLVGLGSTLFNQLTTLSRRIDECRAQTRALVTELGSEEWVSTSHRPLAGGIGGIRYASKPEGWKPIHSSYYVNMFYPKSIPANKKLLERMTALPTIDRDELNNTVGFKRQWIGFTQYSSPGVKFGDDFHLVEIAEECQYEPLPGMVEITVSEFNRLKALLDADKEVTIPAINE